MRERFELIVPPAYIEEFADNPELSTMAVRISLDPQDPSRTEKKKDLLEQVLKDLGAEPFVLRLWLAVPHGQFLEQSLASLDLPPVEDPTDPDPPII